MYREFDPNKTPSMVTFTELASKDCFVVLCKTSSYVLWLFTFI